MSNEYVFALLDTLVFQSVLRGIRIQFFSGKLCESSIFSQSRELVNDVENIGN